MWRCLNLEHVSEYQRENVFFFCLKTMLLLYSQRSSTSPSVKRMGLIENYENISRFCRYTHIWGRFVFALRFSEVDAYDDGNDKWNPNIFDWMRNFAIIHSVDNFNEIHDSCAPHAHELTEPSHKMLPSNKIYELSLMCSLLSFSLNSRLSCFMFDAMIFIPLSRGVRKKHWSRANFVNCNGWALEIRAFDLICNIGVLFSSSDSVLYTGWCLLLSLLSGYFIHVL